MKASPVVNSYESARDYLDAGRNDTYRKIANNTYVEATRTDGPIWFTIRLYATVVVTYLPDGTQILNSGGYRTATTADRIRNYSAARLGSEGGQWVIWHHSDPLTPPKIQKCRKCHGAGKIVNQHYCYGANAWRGAKVCEHGKTLWHSLPSTVDKCSQCLGEGRYDYGSKPIHTPFEDGIRVDATGKVVDR